MATTRSKSAPETKRGFQEVDEAFVSLKFVKELLEQQQSTMKTFISAFMNSVNVRIDSLIKDVAIIKTSLEFTQGQVDELIKNELNLKGIKSNIEHLEDKIDDLDLGVIICASKESKESKSQPTKRGRTPRTKSSI